MITVTKAVAYSKGSDLPVWVNSKGKRFNVSSARFDQAPDGAWMPDMETPPPAAPAVIAGMEGRDALAAMGLTPEVDEQ